MVEKLQKLKGPLKRWNKDVLGHIDSTISKFEKELAESEKRIDENSDDEVSMARINALKV